MDRNRRRRNDFAKAGFLLFFGILVGLKFRIVPDGITPFGIAAMIAGATVGLVWGAVMMDVGVLRFVFGGDRLVFGKILRVALSPLVPVILVPWSRWFGVWAVTQLAFGGLGVGLTGIVAMLGEREHRKRGDR